MRKPVVGAGGGRVEAELGGYGRPLGLDPAVPAAARRLPHRAQQAVQDAKGTVGRGHELPRGARLRNPAGVQAPVGRGRQPRISCI
eukprot:2904354-Pyramimonas_sp.AAC.1